jgi:plasmid segregation protein ParM
MLPTYPYGHDFGNSETCGVLFDRGMQRSITLLSATAPGSLHDLMQKRSAMSESYATAIEALKRGEYVLEHNGNELFLGDLALKQSKAATSARGDMSRYWSSRSLQILLCASGSIIKDAEYHLSVVTGLPVETFGNTDIRRKVKAALEGEHHFTLNGKNRLAVVRVMKVVMEGAGALIACGASDEITQGCIDIGGRTTDLFVAEGQSPTLYLCRGKDIGVENVADLVSNRFQAQYHRPLKLSETRDLLHAHANHRTSPAVYVNGSQVNEFELRQWLDTALGAIGNEIASFVSTTWNTSEAGAVGSDIAHIVLVGGGAYYFGEAIAARIPHVVIPSEPELANAVGYAALAEQLADRSRSVA